MNRGMILLGTLLVLVGIIAYFTLPGGKKEVKTLQEPFFYRSFQIDRYPDPPQYAVDKGVENRRSRLLDRIEWGRPESVNWTIECLVKEADHSLFDEVVRRIDSHRDSDKIKAKKYIDLLSELKEPAAEDFLILYSRDPSEMIRRAALNGLGRFHDEKALSCLLEHAASSWEKTRKISLELLVDRKDPKVLDFFRKALAESDEATIPFAIKALAAQGDENDRSLVRPFMGAEENGKKGDFFDGSGLDCFFYI